MRDRIAEAYRLNEMEWVSYLKFQVGMAGGECDALRHQVVYDYVG